MTVAGPPGIGKSRLVRELAGQLDDATVLVGRCVSYGEGVTYRPLAEIVRSSAARIRGAIAELLDGRGIDSSRRVLGAIGLSEGAARPKRPSGRFGGCSRRAAARPAAGRGRRGRALGGADAARSARVPRRVLGAQPSGRLPRPARAPGDAARVGGAPPEQIAADAGLVLGCRRPRARDCARAERSSRRPRADRRDGRGQPAVPRAARRGRRRERRQAAMPSSIQAVLAARIDRLEPGERTVLEHASVEGRSFHSGRSRTCSTATDVDRTAWSLCASSSSGPTARAAGEDAFRFAHALIREAAYCGCRRGGARTSTSARPSPTLRETPRHPRDKTIGYPYRQLSQSSSARSGSTSARALATAAAERLATAADAALLRGDFPARAASLLERATALLEPSDPARGQLLPRLGAALLDAGRLADAADRILAEAIERAGDDPWLNARARWRCSSYGFSPSPAPAPRTPRRSWTRRSPSSRRAGTRPASAGRCACRAMQAWVEGRSWRSRRWSVVPRRRHARRAGDQAALFEILVDWRAASAALWPDFRCLTRSRSARRSTRRSASPRRRRPDVPAAGGAPRDRR